MSRHSFNATKKKNWKDFLSQTGTTKFQKTRSTREAAHAVFGANGTRLGDAANDKAAFHGYWQFSGRILKGARADFRTRTQRGDRSSVWQIFNQAVPTSVSRAQTQFSVVLGCIPMTPWLCYPSELWTYQRWSQQHGNRVNQGCNEKMHCHLHFSKQTLTFTASSFLKSAYYDSKFSLWVLEETI